MSASSVYRIISPAEWQEAQRRGVFTGSADDARDGFIHFSTAEQVPVTHEKHYGGRAGLLLLEIDAAKLGAALRYEPSRGGALFPHLYGTLPVDAVIRVQPLEARPA
jgi:uncharacterized protein (DUF952 family)